jgi:hypothetical protein
VTHVSINPKDFARLMALPRSDRMDLLEFIGSTPLGRGETGKLVRRLTARDIDHGSNGPGDACRL